LLIDKLPKKFLNFLKALCLKKMIESDYLHNLNVEHGFAK
jgi:hypothetical protein